MTVVAVCDGLFKGGESPGDQIDLIGSRCSACQRLDFPATPVCAACGSPAEDEDLPADARLVGWTSVRYAPPGALIEVPYYVGVACFGSDLCVMGLVDGPGEELDFGLPVRTVALAVTDDRITYGFQPDARLSA